MGAYRATFISACALIALWPAAAAENAAIPNFGMDSTVGWIAGVPDSKDPIGDDFLSPAERAGSGDVGSRASLYRQPIGDPHRAEPDLPCRRFEQPDSPAVGARGAAQSE